MKNKLLSTILIVSMLMFSCKNENQDANDNSTVETEAVSQDKEIAADSTATDSQENITNEADTVKPVAISSRVIKSEIKNNKIVDLNAEKTRKQHEQFLNQSPFKNSTSMSKADRKLAGLAPNKYFEQEWELTMDPKTGKPDIQGLYSLRKQLADERELAQLNRTPGDASDNPWIERGPNNVGGRVRAVMFDPNDATGKTVFAGGVSGGLWKNTDITNSNTQWSLVSLPDNLSVSSISYDPNNTNIFYVGTGESYVGGDVNGDGLWKSTDGGNTWTNVFGGITGPTVFESEAIVSINSPGAIAGDYPCYPTTAFGPVLTSVLNTDIELVSDTNPLGCNANPITNSVSGKIALIRRGNCAFVEKILNAQNAGAVAVIMMNNIAGTPIPMGGTDAGITIPSVMISKEDGDILEAAVLAGTVNGSLINGVGSFTGLLIPGQQHINDVVVKNNGGVSEIYVAAADGYYGSANALTFMGATDFGLYKSTNGGASWVKLSLPLTSGGYDTCPNDIEIGADGRIWVSTTNSFVFGEGGGRVFMSNDGGVSFTLMHTVTGNGGGQRVELEASATNPNKLYVLSELGQANSNSPTIECKIELTTNGFATAPTVVSLPSDGTDSRISTYGFTGAQAFYDLMIESNPSNDNEVYVGGLNLYKSTNSGSSWVAISQWNGGNFLHSDQHGMAFNPFNNNQAIFGNDGGVYFCSSLSSANNRSSNIPARNNGLNITQFYSVGVAPTSAVSGLSSGDYFAAGAQDNGTQYFENVNAGVNGSVRSQGGDGAFTMMDQGSDKYYISNYVHNGSVNYRLMVSPFTVRALSDDTLNDENGAFIAPMVLDSNLDVLYSDYSSGTNYSIRRYKNIKSGAVNRTTITDALLTSRPTAFAVSPYTTTKTNLLIGTVLGKLIRVTGIHNNIPNPVWTDITGPSFVGSVSDIEYGQTENDIFVTMHNYNVVSVWYSADGGATWSNKEGNLPDMPVKCILQNPLNLDEVIIGTELGVWYTNNFSAAFPTWNQSYNGMSNVKVTDLDLRNDNVVYAATYGRGIFSGQFTSQPLHSDGFVKTNLVTVYPNPATDILTINVKDFSGNMNVELYDVKGQKVLSQNEANFSNEKSINISSLAAGIYVLKVNADNLSYTQKVIKK